MARFESSRPHAQDSICYFRQLEEMYETFTKQNNVCLVAETATNNTAASVVRHLQEDT
jgi:hypothetical protein